MSVAVTGALIIGLGTMTYIFLDGRKRDASSLWFWVMAPVFVGLFILPFWWAFRPLKENETRNGGAPYLILKYFAILFAIQGLLSMALTFALMAPLAFLQEGLIIVVGIVMLVGGSLLLVPAGLAYGVALLVKRDEVERGSAPQELAR